jgi:putative serine protease PepD
VVERVGPSVAAVRVHRGDGDADASAVVVRSDGYLVTDAAAVRGAQRVEVLVHGGGPTAADVVGVDELTGVAVLHVDEDGLSPARVGHSDRVALGARVTLVGARAGRGWEASVQTAMVSAMAPRIQGADGTARYGMIVVDEPFGPAATGGALVGLDGTVAGIATAAVAEGHAGMATPIELVVHVAEQLIRHGRARHVWLGLHGTDSGGEGAVVEDVMAGSPAAAAGLAPGDVVVEVDGEATPSMAELIAALRLHLPGDLVTLRVDRDGETRDVRVHLASRAG